ncbi:hypothetical protein, partial [Pseudomonas viridiflava]|uniref:hypothetical protein n=1 Tax=Pseudomonas viridiflava TaxID=33069 RepID=UPI002B1D3DBC
VVALLGMLWVAQRNDAGEGGVLQTRAARRLLGVVLAQCSVLPPCGGFALLWAALAGGSYSVEATQPVMALLAVMLVAFFVALGVLLSAALV